MNRLKGRGRSKSIGTPLEKRNRSERRTPQQEDNRGHDEFYIPGGKGLFVTRSNSGKPALGRKKSHRLLEDYGFDILGQSFGVPSRIDFERKLRRRPSFRSPIAVTSPSFESTPRGRSSKYDDSSELETPTGRRKSRVRSDSASAVDCQHHYHCNCTLHHGQCHYEAPTAKPSILKSSKSNLSTKSFIPVPSPREPPTWNIQPPSAPSTTSNQVPPPMNLPTGSQGNATQNASLGNLPTWTSPQAHTPMSPHFVASPISPVFPGFRSASMPIFVQPQSSPTPYAEARARIHPIPGGTPIHPNQSPFTPSLHPHGNKGTPNSISPFKYSPSDVKKCEEHYKAALAQAAKEKAGVNKENKGEEKDKQNNDISKHIQHRHFCAAYGAMRSRAYHHAHPLERGQIPERNYCNRCMDAAAVKDEGRKEPTRSSSGTHNNPRDASPNHTKVNEYRSSPGNQKGHVNNSWSRNWGRKTRRLSLLSNLLPSSTASGGRTQPSETVVSEPDSEYIPTAPVPIPKEGQGRVEDGVKDRIENRAEDRIENRAEDRFKDRVEDRIEDRTGRSTSSRKQAAPNGTADAFPVRTKASSHAQGGFADKSQRPVSERTSQAKHPGPPNEPQIERPSVATQAHRPSSPSRSTYDKIRIPSEASMNEKRSKLPRPATNPSEATSKGSVKGDPEPSEAVHTYHQPQYKAPVVVDEEEENENVVFSAAPVETSGSFETAKSNIPRDKFRAEQPTADTKEDKSNYEDKRKDRRDRDQRRRPSPMIPRSPMIPKMSEQQRAPEVDERADRRKHRRDRDDAKAFEERSERTDRRRSERHRDDTRKPEERNDDKRSERRRDDAGTSRKGRKEAHLRFADEVPAENPTRPDYAAGWDWPPPPSSTNPRYPNTGTAPNFTDDFWGINRDSANSGTGFSRMVPSFLTRSEISVESYGSNGGGPGDRGSGPSATYRLDDTSDTGGESTDEDYRQVKKLEYSSKDDHDQKTAARTRTHRRNRTSSTHDRRSREQSQRNRSTSRSQQGRSSSSKKPHEKKSMQPSTANESGNVARSSPQAAESSTVAHTGHSKEGLPGEHNNTSIDTGRRRRVRRPSRI